MKHEKTDFGEAGLYLPGKRTKKFYPNCRTYNPDGNHLRP
jgi:hypothetical protein